MSNAFDLLCGVSLIFGVVAVIWVVWCKLQWDMQQNYEYAESLMDEK